MLRRLKSHLDTTMDKFLSAETKDENSKPSKFEYSRPEFLHLNDEKLKVSQDFANRPIVTPSDQLPFNAGYAECINGGKSNLNEDQSSFKQYFVDLEICELKEVSAESADIGKETEMQAIGKVPKFTLTYFGMFDGHAGPDAALMTSRLLHKHIMERLQSRIEVIKYKLWSNDSENKTENGSGNEVDKFGPLGNISVDSIIVGAVEESFVAMDEQIKREKSTFSIRGGCAVIVAIFAMGKLFVANAGDCRAVVYNKGKAVRLSRDMTPYSERQRILALGMAKPELLHEEFTCYEYLKRVTRSDIGKPILYRGPFMAGWGYKIADQDDLKVPLITSTGNKSRLMQTIGVARGFGDHDLRLYDSNIFMKPFLSAYPEVCVFDLKTADLQTNDVLVIGSDGLWDLMSIEEVYKSVNNVLQLYDTRNLKRYISAAQELVTIARGTLNGGNWKRKNGEPGSFDDISVFVIPLVHS
uniref:PPM-type phosphatase domain-containing protein n=1 Tax=Magallana gigas TaxID=29159 RepID=A0A8W8LPB0_MAGGI|nr:protein phosphatase 1H [Crassostrea gigas]XP_011441231.2 protein phosphatase 1H [Crassostrea gigas]